MKSPQFFRTLFSLLITVLVLAACTSTSQDGSLDLDTEAIKTVGRTVYFLSDDAEQAPNGTMSLNSEALELVGVNGSLQTVGIRFPSIDIPKDAKIEEASIQFAVAEATSMDTTISIRALAQDNPDTFTTSSDLASASKTSQRIIWNIEPWNIVGENGPKQRTPDFANVVQEIVKRPGWTSGNTIAFVIEGGEGTRIAKSRDGSTYGGDDGNPYLQIKWSTSTTPPFPPPTDQADYYVSPEANGNDDNSGTLDKPLKTLAEALKRVEPGDVIQLRGGVHQRSNNKVRKTGTQAQPITIMSYPGETAIIDGSIRGSGYAMRLENVDYYIIQNLTIRNFGGSAGALDLRESNNNIIKNVKIYESNDDGFKVVDSDNNRFENIESYGNGSLESGTSGDGIKITSGANNVISGCLTYQNADDGVDIWGSTGTVVENCVSYENGYQLVDGTLKFSCKTLSNGDKDCGDGNGYKLGTKNQTADSGKIIRRNIAYRNRAINFTTNGGRGIKLYNNISVQSIGDVNGNGVVDYGAGIAVSDFDSNIAKNNVSYKDYRVSDGSSGNQSNNSWQISNTDSNAELDGTFINTTDPKSPDFFKPKLSSPVIDKGTDVGLPFQGSNPDLGAYEVR